MAGLGQPLVRRLSDLARESLARPGGWWSLEIIYRNQPRTLLDRFFLGSRPARGARNRLQALQEEITKCIKQRGDISTPVTVISFGSGPGHEVLGCFERLSTGVRVQATCMDKDATALEFGRALAGRQGLNGSIEYVQGNVLRMESGTGSYDIAVLSGLLDYFDFETAVMVLKRVGGWLAPGGVVLIANMRRHYLASTMEVLGNWHLVYREPDELEEILRESHYEWAEVWLEPAGVFCIGKATRSGSYPVVSPAMRHDSVKAT